MTTKIDVFPIGDRVFLEMDPVKEVEKSIILAESAQEKPCKATVVFVGPGKTFENGVLKPCDVKVGDRVYVPKYGGDEVKLDKTYKILANDDIIAILTGDAAKVDVGK
jgi:chaperonin GroES